MTDRHYAKARGIVQPWKESGALSYAFDAEWFIAAALRAERRAALEEVAREGEQIRERAADYCLEWALRGRMHPEADLPGPAGQVPPDTPPDDPYYRGWIAAMRHASKKIRELPLQEEEG